MLLWDLFTKICTKEADLENCYSCGVSQGIACASETEKVQTIFVKASYSVIHRCPLSISLTSTYTPDCSLLMFLERSL